MFIWVSVCLWSQIENLVKKLKTLWLRKSVESQKDYYQKPKKDDPENGASQKQGLNVLESITIS